MALRLQKRYIFSFTLVALILLLKDTYLKTVAVIAMVISLMMANLASKPKDSAPSVKEYYSSLGSRLGYGILLGNTRHCGYWPARTIWPFPLGKALRAMEEKLYVRLNLPANSAVLDAGAGSGHVACYMADQHGLRVTGVDLMDSHVQDAQKFIRKRNLNDKVSVQQGDYHDLSAFTNDTFDGIYTMETFVHADNPSKVLEHFYRLLKPGGVLVMHEGEFHWDSPTLQTVLRLSHCQNTLKQGSYSELLTQIGFKEITVEDLSENVLPLWRLFAFLGAGPYAVLKLLGLHERFTNVMAGVETYRNWDQGRYISVRAVKA